MPDVRPSMNTASLGHQVFLTDAEFTALYTSFVLDAIRLLNNQVSSLCKACGGKCCQRVNCGFYSHRFATCPIYEYRPAICRLYHCEQILESKSLGKKERELLDKPVVRLSELLKDGKSFEASVEPQAKVGQRGWLALLGIEEEVISTVGAFEADHINSSLAGTRLKDLVLRCRNQEH